MVSALSEDQSCLSRLSNSASGRQRRAAVVVFSYYPSDTRVMRSAESMVRHGVDVDLLCLREVPDEPDREWIHGVDVTRVTVRKHRSNKLMYLYQYFTFLILSFFWMSRRYWRRRYDLIHIHNMPDYLVFSAVLAKAFGARVILDLHDPTPEVFMTVYNLDVNHWLVRLLRTVERLCIGFADLVLTPNVAFRDLFVSRGCPPRKISIIMNSPLEEVFQMKEPDQGSTFRSREEPFTIMYHGTLVERHGLHTAVEAIARVLERIPNICFHIYGSETAYLRGQVLPLVAELGLKHRIQCFGEQPQNVIARAIADCDLGIVPNLQTVFTEINLPTRIFEYLALGKPVIAPDTRGIRDYFNEDNILFFEPGQVENLACKIQWVFDHPQETKIVVSRGQQVYCRHLWKDQEKRLVNLVSALVAST
jgi:glycosyltransferase involved in cell wall biosynthesis